MEVRSIKHEPNRQVSEQEADLWREYEALRDRSDYEAVRIQMAGMQAGLHEERVRQIVRTWENEGLVRTLSNSADRVLLTEYGRQVDGLE